MGQYHSILIPGCYGESMDIIEAFIDQNRIDDTFILVKSCSSSVKTKNDDETTQDGDFTSGFNHYSVLIELQGSSDNEMIKGDEIGLFIDQNSLMNTFIQTKAICRQKNSFTNIIHIRTYVLNMASITPIMDSKAKLHCLANATYRNFAQKNRGINWSSPLNCHQYSREVVRNLHSQWLSNLTVVDRYHCFVPEMSQSNIFIPCPALFQNYI